MKECNMQYEYENQQPTVGVIIFLHQQAKPWQTRLYWISWN